MAKIGVTLIRGEIRTDEKQGGFKQHGPP